MTLPRRLVLGLPALLAARPAAAQTPCLGLEGTGTPGQRITVFGQAFAPGAVPAGAGLSASFPGMAPEPVQCDIRARHPDGSVRLAQLALTAPGLRDGQRIPLRLQATNAPAPATTDVAALLRGREALLEIGGWRLDLLAALPPAIAARPWQAGPLAHQARQAFAVPPAVAGGVASLRIIADLALRLDGTLWVDLWFRNDIAMQPLGGEAQYTARLTLDGRTALEATIARQHQYTAWGRLLGAGPEGTARPPPRILHDATALADAAAIPRYGVTTGVEEALLARFGAATRAPGWETPLGPRGITQDMRQGGGRPDIGPATQSQAAWLISNDRRAAAHAIGQAEAAGSIPWHFWDGAAQGWLDPRRWPRLWIDPRGGLPPGGLAQPMATDTGWVTDPAHQPDLSFVPYLLTGRRAFLDNLQAQAAFSVFAQWPAQRGNPASGVLGDGANLVRGNQLRGAAWSLRQVENAAWASRENDPALPWLRHVQAGNWGWLRAQIPLWTRQQGETRGRIPGEYGIVGVTPPWQQDYFATTAALAAMRGSADARFVLAWMSQFLLGRFMAGGQGFAPHDGVAYLLATGQPGTPRSWAELGQATRAANLSNGTGWSKSQGDYAQLARAALAMLADALDEPLALRLHRWLAAAGAPFVSAQDYRRDPLLNIVPRADTPPRCAASERKP
jgi:hypothetical protein